MKNEYVELLIPIAILVGAYLVFRVRLHIESRRFNKIAEEKQGFLTEKVDELRRLVGNPHIDINSLKVELETILTEMESVNTNGELDEFIADNRSAIKEELKQRSAA